MNAPSDDRFFGFAYEKFLTSTITYVQQGRRSSALDHAHETAPARMADSYQAAAKGMTRILEDLDVVHARRKQHNVVVVDPETGDDLVSLRLHLLLESADRTSVAAHLYFSQQALTLIEQHVMQTAVALAAEQLNTGHLPAIGLVRAGHLQIVRGDALTVDRLDVLRMMANEYRLAWDDSL